MVEIVAIFFDQLKLYINVTHGIFCKSSIIASNFFPLQKVQKRRGKLVRKNRGPKASIAKLSNKRLNRLAKQGKLKRLSGRKNLKHVLSQRMQPGKQSEEGSREEQKPDPDDIPIEEADYEYFATPGRTFDFLLTNGLGCFNIATWFTMDIGSSVFLFYSSNVR